MKKAIAVLLFLALLFLIFIRESDVKANVEIVSSENTSSKSISEKLKDINEDIIQKETEITHEEIEKLRNKITYYAIFASDERGTEISRSDIIMILKFIPKENKIVIVSTPRDTRVMIPNMYEDKINHAFAFGGVDLLEETLEKLYDFKIDYYIHLNFKDFVYLIDSLGGIEVNAIKDYEYPNYISIREGLQVLDGDRALDYVRFRYDEEGDLGRIKRQQEVLINLFKKIRSYDEDEKIDFINEFYSVIDTDIKLEELINYNKILSPDEKIDFESYTLNIEGKIINKIWYGIYDEEDLLELKEILSSD